MSKSTYIEELEETLKDALTYYKDTDTIEVVFREGIDLTEWLPHSVVRLLKGESSK